MYHVIMPPQEGKHFFAQQDAALVTKQHPPLSRTHFVYLMYPMYFLLLSLDKQSEAKMMSPGYDLLGFQQKVYCNSTFGKCIWHQAILLAVVSCWASYCR